MLINIYILIPKVKAINKKEIYSYSLLSEVCFSSTETANSCYLNTQKTACLCPYSYLDLEN